MSVSSDRRLAQRMARGERRAFEEFLDSYGPRIQRLVRRALANPSDADDAVQEVFIELFRCIGQYRGEAALMSWVYRVALNRCRRYGRDAAPATLPYDEALDEQADWRLDPACFAARGELADRVNAAVDRLPAIHREVVLLHEMEGLTYVECAEALEIPVGTVKSRLSTAFRHLRAGLAPYVIGETCGEAAV